MLTPYPEQLSHELSLRFATKCFSNLELTHFKDNFRTLCDAQDGLKYWKEDTLCRFLSLPDAVEAGPVVYQMATYLGAFPFPSLAPSILTLETMVKVVVIMTERYSRVLKRGRKDRIRLLFRSLAVYDRRMSVVESPAAKEKPKMEDLVEEQKPDDVKETDGDVEQIRSLVAGFAIDEPISDEDEDEDDDELALAALDSLDAIEVYKQAEKRDRKIHHAQVPTGNFRKLVLLLLVMAPLRPLESISRYGEGLSKERLAELEAVADAIIAAFDPGPASYSISYHDFNATISVSLPYLFEPLNALFEHFLFSRNIDLSRRRTSFTSPASPPPILSTPSPPQSPILPELSSKADQPLLNHSLLSHISFFLPLHPATPNLFHANPRFHSLYSATTHGTSLTSFSRQVLSWSSPTLLLLSGTPTHSLTSRPLTIGLYLPCPWTKPRSPSPSPTDPSTHPTLFLLSPRHALFPFNPYHQSTSPTLHFHSQTGISLGCIIPPTTSRSHTPTPVPGPVSLMISPDLETATFSHPQHSPLSPLPSSNLTGAFLPSASLSNLPPSTSILPSQTMEIQIDALEVWGISLPPTDGDTIDPAERQRKELAWREAESERRKGVNFGGDKDGARALLEMAGLVGDHGEGGRGRSGGSV